MPFQNKDQLLTKACKALSDAPLPYLFSLMFAITSNNKANYLQIPECTLIPHNSQLLPLTRLFSLLEHPYSILYLSRVMTL